MRIGSARSYNYAYRLNVRVRLSPDSSPRIQHKRHHKSGRTIRLEPYCAWVQLAWRTERLPKWSG